MEVNRLREDATKREEKRSARGGRGGGWGSGRMGWWGGVAIDSKAAEKLCL